MPKIPTTLVPDVRLSARLIGRGAPLAALAALATFLGCGLPGAPAAAQVPFANLSAASGLDLGGFKHGGLAWGDFNTDGCLDLLVNHQDTPEQSRLYLQYAPGGVCAGTFDDVTACIVSGLANYDDVNDPVPVSERSSIWGDIDNDGDLDLAINNHGIGPTATHSVEVYLNAGSGSTSGVPCGYDPDGGGIDPVPWAVFAFSGQVAIGLTEVLDTDGFPPDTRQGRLQHLLIEDINLEHVSFNDFDKDGDLDLIMDNHARGVVVLQNRWNVAPAQWIPCGSPPCNQTPMVHNTTSGLPFCVDTVDDPPLLECTPNMGDYGVSGDFDRDGDVDFVVRKRTGVADYFRNDGVGPAFFNDVYPGVDLDDTNNPIKGGVSICDFDSDGDFDLFWTDGGVNQIWEQTGSPATPAADGSGSFSATNEPVLSTGVDFSDEDIDDAVCGDWDHDGDLDLFLTAGTHATPSGDFFFRNQFVQNGGILTPPADRLQFSCRMGPDPACSIDTTTCDTASGHIGCGTGEGAAMGDYDRDGDLDLVINQSDDDANFPGRFDFNELWRNTTNNTSYLKVRALWDVDGVAGGTTRDAIGATVQLLDCGGRLLAPIREINGGRGHGSQDPPRAHFGFQYGPSYPYFVRVEFVGGTVVQAAVLASSLGSDQTLTVRSTDASTSTCLTPAVVGSLVGRESDQGLWLEFETFAELGTLGFRVYRTEEGRAFTADPDTLVGDELLLAQPPVTEGSRYRLLDRAAEPPYERYRYYVVETDTGGRHTVRGPFTPLAVEPALAPEAAASAPLRALERMPRVVAVASAERGGLAQERRGPALHPRSTGAPPSALKVLVRDRGLVRIQAADIAAGLGRSMAEITTRLAESSLALESLGQPVAWRASEDGEALLFFAQESPSLYTAENVYWLRPGTGLLMTEAPGSPSSAALPFADGFESGDLSACTGSGAAPAITSLSVEESFEENRFAATASAADPEADYWFWAVLSPGHPTLGRATLELEVEAPVPGASAELSLALVGASTGAPAPELRVLLNGVELGLGPALPSGRSPGYSPSLRFSAPPGVLQAGANTVEVEALGPAGGASVFYLDRVDLAYERELQAVGDRLELVAWTSDSFRVDGFSTSDVRVLEVSDPLRPIWVAADPDSTGAGFGVRFVPQAPDARYLVVASAGLVQPLELRPASSEPSVLDTAAAADYLVLTHAALVAAAQPLIAHRSAQGLATALLDVESIYDQLSFGLRDPRAIRTLLELTEPPAGERFVVLAGHGHYDYRDYLGLGYNLLPPLLQPSDGGLVASDQRFVDYATHPRTAIGRIPAHNAAELGRYLDKLLAYEAGGGSWTSSVLLVADYVADQSEFDYGSEVLEATLPAPFSAHRVSLRQSGLEAARQDLFERLAQGAAVLGYTGHGGIDRLSADSLLTAADIPDLGNFDRAPIVTALTCNIARFDLPAFDSLGEALILEQNGASAVLGSVALSDSHQALDLGLALYDELFSGQHQRLGEALLAARLRFLEAGGESEMVELYTLLGDPALVLP